MNIEQLIELLKTIDDKQLEICYEDNEFGKQVISELLVVEETQSFKKHVIIE